MSLMSEPAPVALFTEAIAAESIGWLPMQAGVYLHVGKPDEDEAVIEVVGIPDATMAGTNVLLVLG